MKRISLMGILICFLPLMIARAQTFPTPDYFQQLVSPLPSPERLPDPEGFRDCVVGGKLRLALPDAIRLTLLNNTEAGIDHLSVEDAKYNVLRTYQPFDPVSASNFSASRAKSPTYSQLQGATTLSDLEQEFSSTYSQMFQSGTSYQIGIDATKSSTNSIYYFFNPSIFTDLGFSITQPLLRGFGFFPNRAPIVIAQRNLKQSEAVFKGEVSDLLLQAITQYWAVVEARESLDVLQKSLELAEATYKQNKRALELGALPPLDIYRSEAEVANRRVSVIQAEYTLKQVVDQFRRTLGADQDPNIKALDLELVENTEPSGELFSIDQQAALKSALESRPELEALRQQLMSSETSIRLAHNNLLPKFNLTGFYRSNGLGGNQYDTSLTPSVLVSQGGLPDAIRQVLHFDYPTYGFNLSLNLPIKNRSAAADLGNALVSKRRALYQIRQVQENLSLEVSNAVHQLDQAKVSMAATRIARDLGRKNLEAEERKYELGAQTIFFVLEAQTQLAQAEVNLVQAEVNYQLALATVDHATGALLSRYNIQVENAVRRP